MKYVFLTAEEANALDFSEVREESIDKLRFSLDSSKTFVRYSGDQPSSLAGKIEYTQSEVASIMLDTEWTSPDEI
jgi:hypothetical protein